MLKATSKVDCDTITKWVNEKAEQNHYRASYISIREFLIGDCELDGCVKYQVHWLTYSELKYQNFYVDQKTHQIVYVTRYM